jgi:hypothetical protein
LLEKIDAMITQAQLAAQNLKHYAKRRSLSNEVNFGSR